VPGYGRSIGVKSDISVSTRHPGKARKAIMSGTKEVADGGTKKAGEDGGTKTEDVATEGELKDTDLEQVSGGAFQAHISIKSKKQGQ
jgi:hypothetical protein